MLTRILAAVVLLPLLLLVVLVLPEIVTAVLFSAMSAIAAWELLHNTHLVENKLLIAAAMVMAALVPLWCYFGMLYIWALPAVLVYTAVVFGTMMKHHGSVSFSQVAVCFVGGILIPFLFSSLVRIHGMENGRLLILLPMVMAFMPDTGAYFAGRFFGKHKLAPVISPKKTVEGVVGGVISAIVGVIVYALVLQKAYGFTANFLFACIYGFVGAFAAVFGDLCFSVIKRQTGIKDYGNLIPGHGGILDRFDSMMIVGPLAETLLLLIPLVK